MADSNLRTLSAPLEALRNDVIAAYERLDEKWDAIAKQLSSLPIPCPISYSYWSDEYGREHACLEFKKWNGKKRICDATYSYYGPEEEVTTTPYEEWSGDQRLAMLEHVPALFAKAVEKTKEFIERTKE